MKSLKNEKKNPGLRVIMDEDISIKTNEVDQKIIRLYDYVRLHVAFCQKIPR